MRRLAIWVLLTVVSCTIEAQTITMKNGTVVVTKGLRRSGDSIMATVDLPAQQPGGSATSGELGYPIGDIAKIDFPKPYQLQAAIDAINAGKPLDAMNDLQPVLTYYNAIRDVPGSWWADATLLDVRALIRLDREDDAEQLAAQMGQQATDPDVVRAANVYAALAVARRGSQGQALTVYETVGDEAKWPEALALAAFYRGELHLGREEWDQALLGLLEIPVFYPDQQVLMPEVLLGSAQAYLGLHDYQRAKTALDELALKYPATPQAAQGRLEADKLAKLEASSKPSH